MESKNDIIVPKKYKYTCEKCNFFTNSAIVLEKHKLTGKHISGKRLERGDKQYPDKCPSCEYVPKSCHGYMQHKLNFHSTKEDRKKEFKYFCEKCDFGSFSKKLFERHEETTKHKLISSK